MRRADGVKVTRLTPGGLFACHGLVTLRGVVRGEQKSTEAEVAAAHGSEGPYTGGRTITERSMLEGGAAKKAEKPERARRAGGGSSAEAAVSGLQRDRAPRGEAEGGP